jgi:phosphatidylinositol alpha-mannosyltransferase
VRIALVSPYDLDVVGGVQVHVLAVAAALRAAGDDVHVIGPGRSAAGRTGLGASVSVPANGSRAPIALDPRVASRLTQLLGRLQPDVVHVHEPLVPLVGVVATLTRVAPVVVTFHAAAEHGSLAPLYRSVRRPARHIVRRAAAMIAVSDTAARFHARALGLDPARLLRIPNGVDVARFAAAAANRGPHGQDGPSHVMVLGRLEHRKGVDVALRAFLQAAGRRKDLHLSIVGEGPLRSRLEARIASEPADIAARIALLGRVAPEELPARLATADVLVVPSRGGESFGMVLLEAMAAGVPIVASDIDGYRDVARADREALLVAPDDPVALAQAIERVLDDRPLRQGLVAAGHERAAAHDWARVAEQTRAVLRAAASDRP